MTIYELTKLFWRSTRTSGPNSNDALLFFYLVERCNLGGWKNPFTVSSRDVASDLNLPRKTLATIRSRLKQNGLIDYIPGKSKRESPIYCFPEVSKDGSLLFPRDFQLKKQDLAKSASRSSLKTELKTERVTDKVTLPVTLPVTDKVTLPVTLPVTDKVTLPVTDSVTDKVTILKDYNTKNIEEEDAREAKVGFQDRLKNPAETESDYSPTLIPERATVGEAAPNRSDKATVGEAAQNRPERATVGEVAPNRPDVATDLRIRRAEAEVQCHQVRQDVLSRPSMLEAFALKHDSTPEGVTEAVEEVLADWTEGGILHTAEGHFDLSGALLHLRHLLPIKLGIIRRRAERLQEDKNERKTTKNQNYGKQYDRYAAQRAAEPRAKKHADFNSAF